MRSVAASVFVVLITIVISTSGCRTQTAKSDAQIAGQVQSTLRSDANISGEGIEVQANQGIVTLNGEVSNNAERALAAVDAAKVDGVKTVVNNLVVRQAEAASQVAPAREETVPVPSGRKNAQRHAASANKLPKQSVGKAPVIQTAAATQPSSLPPMAEPGKEVIPPPPPAPKKVTIPAGTQVTIRLNEGLDTERNQVGDSFQATLGAPIVMNDETVIPSGADVVGRVVDLKSAGRMAGNSALTLELNSLSVNGRTYNIQTSQWSRQGKGEGKDTAIKTGGGAAVGAIIGGIAGGGKGAAIGSVAGAGAGAGVSAAKKGEQIKLAPESSLSFLLISPITVTQQSTNRRDAGRTELQK